jgi:HAD superfamily phosphatase (TIGR01668 family)
MFEKFIPDKYYKSIYDIDYKALKKTGIKCVIFGLSNTLVPEGVNMPDKKLKDLMEYIKDLDLEIIIMSNSSKKVVTPFKEGLCVDSSYLSFKPFKYKYKKIAKIFNYKYYEVACIGSNFLFDILGANRMNYTSILVNPVSIDEYAVTKLNRKLENIVVNNLTEKNLFKRGRYYD